MGNVLIRNIPDEIITRLKRMAEEHNRSLQQELRFVLENTVTRSSKEVFQKATQIRKKLRRKAIPFTDSTRLLREDRAR